MPFSRIYYPQGAFSDADKAAIAKNITDVYAEDYPRGATLVTFVPTDGYFKGGKLTSDHVRITVQHMRGSYTTDHLENYIRMKFRDAWKPYVDDRGMGYELQIEEIPAEQISFNNLITNTLLGEPLLKEMIKDDELFPLKSVKG